MKPRRTVATRLGAAACVGLLLSGAVTPLVPLGCLLLMSLDLLWFAPRGFRPRASVLLALQLLLVVPFGYLALLRDSPVDFLTLLLVATAPLLVIRSLQDESEFNDFLVILLSLLLVVGSAALAPGALPVAITAIYLLVGCQALRVLATAPDAPATGVRFRLERPVGWWAAAPALASHHLAVGGLLLGALFYLVAPRPDDPAYEEPVDHAGMFSAPAGRDTGSRTSTFRPDFPREVRLGDFGRLKRRTYPALQVEIRARGRPYDPTESERSMLLLRARAWERFVPSARSWELPRSRSQPVPEDGVLEKGDTEIDWSFDVLGYDGKTMFLPQRARRVRAAGGDLAIDRTGTMTSSVPVFQYSIASAWPVRVGDVGKLIADARAPELLQVPDAAARVLDRELPRPARRGVAAAVAAVAEYFAGNGFRYTLELPKEIESAADPLDAFLELREGDCEMYATVACLMLRRLGVPARVAGGLRVAERLGPGRYLGRLSNAHAWVEVPCRGVGFVPFDFTPPDETAKPREETPEGHEDEEGGRGGEEGSFVDWRDPFAYGPEEQERVIAWIEERILGWPLALVAAGIVLLALVPPVVAAIRRRPRNPLGVTAPKDGKRTTLAFYARFLRACASRGFVRARVETPREFLATLPRELRDEGARITEEFERHRYGP